MAAVNEAYEVLSNPGASSLPSLLPALMLSPAELRERFDNGEDPNDAQQQQQQGSPFGGGGFNFFQQQGSQQFFQQGGGGGGGFKFKFG